MSMQYAEYELLEKALLRDYWREDEACWFFLGCKRDNNRLYYLTTGTEPGRPVREKLWKDFNDLKERWSQTTHDRNYADGLYLQDKHYCLVWAQEYRVGNKLQECLDWGLQEGLIKQDRLDAIKEDIALKETHSNDKTVSEKELENRLRLIGTMLDILTNADGKQKFSSNNQLINHIRERYQGQGLSETVLKETFSRAKKLMERKPTIKGS